MQTDPIGCAGGLNLYAYCNNNPVNWTDPLGLASDWTDTPQRSPGQEWQEWLNIMRLATFYSSTWGEWPDLTEFDYDWTGASSDSQGATKGKPPKVKHLNQEEFDDKIRNAINNKILNQSRWFSQWNPYNYMIDSDFWQDRRLYEYGGLVATGNEWNYYCQGVLFHHFHHSRFQLGYYIYGWNIFNNRWPTDNKFTAAMMGWMDYNEWANGR